MSSYAERVAQAPNLPAALLAIAEGLDEIKGMVRVTPANDWSSWGAPTSFEQEVAAKIGSRPGQTATIPIVVNNEDEIARVTEALRHADGDEHRALEAKLRLLKDDGKVIEPPVQEGARLTVDGELVGFPVADAERQASRIAWALTHNLEEMQSQGNSLDRGEMAVAFGKGGPMWLYLYDRDAVMRLDEPARRTLIADIEQDSPAEAQEIGRDILKDLSAEGSRETALGGLG